MKWFSPISSDMFFSEASGGLITVGIVFAALFAAVFVLTVTALRRNKRLKKDAEKGSEQKEDAS